MAPEHSGFTLQPWSQIASRVTGVAEYMERHTPCLRISFPYFFFFFTLIIIAGTSSIAGKTDNKITFLIPLFDCFITWVTQSKGSRGPMHSRHYAGNLFSLAWSQSQSCMCGVWLFIILFFWCVRGYGGFSRFSQLS